MAWLMRVLGVVLAVLATISVLLLMPVGKHYGITPIHATTIDVVVSGIGYFVMFFVAIGALVEYTIVAMRRPALTRSDRIPIARVVARRA